MQGPSKVDMGFHGMTGFQKKWVEKVYENPRGLAHIHNSSLSFCQMCRKLWGHVSKSLFFLQAYHYVLMSHVVSPFRVCLYPLSICMFCEGSPPWTVALPDRLCGRANRQVMLNKSCFSHVQVSEVMGVTPNHTF